MKLKDLFKRTRKGERPEKIDKTKTAVAEMLLDDELMKMVAGGTSTNWSAIHRPGHGEKTDILD